MYALEYFSETSSGFLRDAPCAKLTNSWFYSLTLKDRSQRKHKMVPLKQLIDA